MNVWQFTSEAYPLQSRDEHWQETMQRFGFRCQSLRRDFISHDVAIARTSPAGIEFVRISSYAQKLIQHDRGDSVLACLPIEGEGRCEPASRTINAGDIVVVPPGEPFSLHFPRAFRLLLLRIPQEIVRARVVGNAVLELTHIRRRAGLGQVVSCALDAVSEALDSLSTSDFRALDLALVEMLLACQSTGANGGTAIQAALLRRIRQDIESRLADSDLTPGAIARAEGLSERYVQKLFETAGENFTSFVRRRRLERCRADFDNPQCDHLSISDICFRWGFNEASHFSRAFREQFGLSPRAYRHQGNKAESETVVTYANRGRPQQSRSALRHGERSNASLTVVENQRGAEDAQRPSMHPEPGGHYLPANDKTVHWGYFSRALAPVIEIASGDRITVETLTQHASDDYERMVKGDAGAESVFHWTGEEKNVDRRGAGPADASVYGRGTGEGFGVHICTGPISVRDARPGDVLEVRILDIYPRPSANPRHAGKAFGSNAASWWGYHYREILSEPKPREVVTLYEIDATGRDAYARPLYNYRWTPQTDPSGVTHATMDYPGVHVDPRSIEKNYGILRGVRVPLRLHFGVIGVAPREADLVDSTPPAYFGGNIDNWRAGKGARVYLPVSVPGALLSIGDPHAAQGDCELSGTAIECSLTGVFEIVLHKKADLAGQAFADLTYPLIETPDEWVLLGFSQPNYLAELGENAQSEVYGKSSLDLAMKDAFRKVRRFLMTAKGLSEDEAISLISVAVDFGVTQVVDGNWGVHAILRKDMFSA
jgi:acetamidase/formamidase/AraC-like DNA-binding protein